MRKNPNYKYPFLEDIISLFALGYKALLMHLFCLFGVPPNTFNPSLKRYFHLDLKEAPQLRLTSL